MMFMWLVPLVLCFFLFDRGLLGPGGHHHSGGHDHGGGTLDVLRMRLARGEISPEEYDRLREKLRTS